MVRRSHRGPLAILRSPDHVALCPGRQHAVAAGMRRGRNARRLIEERFPLHATVVWYVTPWKWYSCGVLRGSFQNDSRWQSMNETADANPPADASSAAQ